MESIKLVLYDKTKNKKMFSVLENVFAMAHMLQIENNLAVILHVFKNAGPGQCCIIFCFENEKSSIAGCVNSNDCCKCFGIIV